MDNIVKRELVVDPTTPLFSELLDIHQLDSSFYQEDPFALKMSYIPNYSGGGNNPPVTYSNVPVSSSMLVHTTQHQQQQQHQQAPPQHQSVSQLKRKMTLDLSNAKRPRVFSVNTPGVIDVLSSPDVQMLKIPTPELDKFIMDTTNPNVLQTPTSVFFPKNVTEAQELYAKGFEHALKQLHDQQDNSSVQSSVQEEGSSNASSYRDGKSGNFVDFSNVVVKEEPQTVPDSYSDDDDDDSSMSDGSSVTGGMGGGVKGSNILPVDMVSQVG